MTATVSDPAALRTTPLRYYLTARFFGMIALQIQSICVAWHIYDLTRTPIALGFVGLAQFIPMFLLILPAGDWADRFDRRWILAGASLLQTVCSSLFLAFALSGTHQVWPFYLTLFLFGIARALAAPSLQSVVALLVAKDQLPRAVALSSSAFQTAIIAGPSAGGAIYLLGAPVAFAVCGVLFLVTTVIFSRLRLRRIEPDNNKSTGLERFFAGIIYLRRRPIILGAISLDLFAVLLGGATALLPVFARDILHVGPTGLGLLQSAPAVGAASTALLLARFPIGRNSGLKMFAGVAVFGLSIILFGLSKNFYLSLFALVILGASDMISVYVRSTLIQLATPDSMRGRVSAVNMLFINASNELGDFESGFMAAWLTAVPAVVVGGLGTIGVAALWAVLFPDLRKVDRLADVEPRPEPEPVLVEATAKDQALAEAARTDQAPVKTAS